MITQAESNTKNTYPLSPKKPIKKTLESSIGILFSLFSLGIVAFSIIKIILKSIDFNIASLLPITIAIIIILYVVLLVLTYAYNYYYYLTYFYDLTENFVIIRKGLFSTREITIPYERIQDVYVDQDILDRILNIYDVHLSSATIYSSFLAHIDGTENQSAQGLREAILNKIQQKNMASSNIPAPSNIPKLT